MTASEQERLNERVWSSGAYLTSYTNRNLRPSEVVLLSRYADAFAGRVLELGCGAGRVTGYLIELAKAVTAIDLAPAMVDFCRSRFPGALYEVRDLRDLDYPDHSFDVVFAGANVLDVLGDEERRRVLADVHRVLAPGGLLVMSSHNRAWLAQRRTPPRLRPVRTRVMLARQIAGMPVLYRNHRRLRKFERFEEDYAIANDDAHRYTLLHYYIDRDAQERQFERVGFELLECLDEDARRVTAGERAEGSQELHYAARAR